MPVKRDRNIMVNSATSLDFYTALQQIHHEAVRPTDRPSDLSRFYERSGLLRKPRRTSAGYRLYAQSDATRLRFIRRAKGLGFSLEEIAELLRLSDGKGRRSAVRAVAERRLREIEHKLAALGHMRDTLQRLVKQCHGVAPRYWLALAAAVPAGYLAAWPINLWLLGRNLKKCH
jgi:MerR family transcriptional regulator, copper efflux regulator